MTKKLILAALSACVFATPLSAQDAPDIELWRLDCGIIQLSDAAPFSDTHLWDGDERTLTDSCYLIRHGDQHMLWDTGLPSALKGTSATQWVFTLSVERTITEQLADLGLTPEDIDFVGISHYHNDHIGQASEFAHAKLLIGRGDAEAVASGAMEETRAQLAPWLAEGAEGEVTRIGMDHDVFQDGSVVIKGMPGHTPGHSTLLVRLPETGDVMLTGDLYHFEEQVENKGIPVFNTNRADTLASFHRFDQMAENLGATVIIQHDPRHIDRLPAFPESAK
ncbi:N-acyl homoserine lactonase family protein [Qipengyuania vesicularis]|uniref:N-acyl homoserine lactonase family protein n=1 Tax=Qipengyuania vesicularis TaxID=2867232 RepID=UPI001C8825B3|nr:N-acyl homoserine lactonase family protein [Qipengyuania vesicularis]MBX7526104.1 N-acyl homoserine lactonase family protein [Qipengyuania vesicularis]